MNHTKITTTQQEPFCRLGKPPGTHTKLEKDQTSVVAQSCLPQTPSQSYKHKPKAPRIDARLIFNNCNLNDHERERFPRFPEQFHAKK